MICTAAVCKIYIFNLALFARQSNPFLYNDDIIGALTHESRSLRRFCYR